MIDPEAALQHIAAGIAITAVAALSGGYRFLKNLNEREESEEERFLEFVKEEAAPIPRDESDATQYPSFKTPVPESMLLTSRIDSSTHPPQVENPRPVLGTL